MRIPSMLVLATASVALSACSGSLGSGGGGTGIGGLSGPVAPNQAPYGAPTPLDRERSLEDSIVYSKSALALPAISGFAIAIDLSGVEPSPSASTSPAAAKSGAATVPRPSLTLPPGAPRGTVYRAFGDRHVLAVDDAIVAQAASPEPSPAGSGAPVLPAATGLASPPAAMSPLPVKPTHKPTASPTPTVPMADVKLIIYPDYAPKPPQPRIKSPIDRVALVSGYMKLPDDATLASLAAIKITIPAGEITPGRGFTIAIFDERKKKKARLVAADTDAMVSKNVVTGADGDSIDLHKGNPYAVVLFADALAASPPPAGVYQPPGNFPGASPGPGQSLAPGALPPNGAAPPSGYNQPYGTPTLTATVPPSYPTFPAQ